MSESEREPDRDAGRERARPDAVDVTGDALEALREARRRLDSLEGEIEEHGEDAVRDAADAYRTASDLLDAYVDRATGTGRETFKAYVQLEGQFESLVDGLDESVPADPFEAALAALDKTRLSEADFERAEDALGPAAAFADLLEDREAARETLASARTAAGRRLSELDDAVAERERLLELASADLDAPVEVLAEPIEAYNDAIREAFAAYRRAASTREVFACLERSRWYPFVDYERPPDDLREYVEADPAGERPIPELLEYADYSRSKLDHYVADAGELKRRVATQRTYLDGIDADPLTIPWPPEAAGVLRHRAREYRPLVARIADRVADGSAEGPDDPPNPVPRLRGVRRLTTDPDVDYERLRTAAIANDRLNPAERERLTDGRVEAELEALRAEREQLEAALERDDPV